MRLVLVEPDIPQNTGTILRLCAGLGLPLDLVEPMGFVWSDAKLRRAGMDYIAQAHVTRHASWARFAEVRPPGRLVLFTTKGSLALPEARPEPDDLLLFGSEGSGAPSAVRAAADLTVRIPLISTARSLNVAQAASIAAYVWAWQTAHLPP